MSDKLNKAAAKVAALQKDYDKAASKVAGLSDNEKPEVVNAAAEDVAKALENLNKAKSEVLVKVKFIKSPTARFGLGYSAGDKGEISLLIAEAVQEEGYGHITHNASFIEVVEPETVK